jgi:hypothetical protein
MYSVNTSNSGHSNGGNDGSIKDEPEGNIEDEDLVEETENEDITKILLKDAKIPTISPTIDDSRWSIKVNHCIRVVAITNEYIDKIIQKFKSGDDKGNNEEASENDKGKDKDKDETPNNKYEEFLETDSIGIHVSPPSSPTTSPVNASSPKIQNNGHLTAEVNLPESRRTSYTGTKELLNTQNLENQKFITENKKYGVILGHLSNGDTPTIPRAQKALDTVFDITIGTMTKTPRIFGKEFKLNEEIEDQYYNSILRKNNINSKLKLVNSSGSISSKNSQKKDDEPDIQIHARIRTNSSSTDSLVLETDTTLNEDSNLRQRLSTVPPAHHIVGANINKELPLPPKQNKQTSKDEKKKENDPVVSQNPPLLPPRNDASTSSPIYQPVLPQYGQGGQQQQPYPLFPNIPQCSNPQEYQPSAPTMEDIDTPPPPYEYSANTNNQYYY